MTGADIIARIARVRRAMPRNPDVMAICDALELRVNQAPANTLTPAANTLAGRVNSKRDRKSYMRDYMRTCRAKQAIKIQNQNPKEQ